MSERDGHREKEGIEVVGESIGTHVIKAECQQPVPHECSSSLDRTHATLHSPQLKSTLLSLCFSLLSLLLKMKCPKTRTDTQFYIETVS